MDDVSPALLKSIRANFREKIANSERVKNFERLIGAGKAKQTDVLEYASELGKLLGESLSEILNIDILPDERLYWNIAKAVIEPVVDENFDLVTTAAVNVQRAIDRSENIGLNPVKPKRPNDRIKGLLDTVTEEGLTNKELHSRLNEPIRNLTESFFDAFIKENAQVRYNAGMTPKIIRIASHKACKWCRVLSGTYLYEDVSDTGNNVFRRHERCRCSVTFQNGKEFQDVHSKQKWKRIRLI